MAKAEVKMAIDPFRVVAAALKGAKRRPRSANITSVDYDADADVLYARFKHGEIVDSEALDAEGMVLASLDGKQQIIGLIVINASSFT